jgi:hypothetical protein
VNLLDKEPEYQFTGVPWTEGALLQNCTACGAVVMDTEVHTEWHREMAQATKRLQRAVFGYGEIS